MRFASTWKAQFLVFLDLPPTFSEIEIQAGTGQDGTAKDTSPKERASKPTLPHPSCRVR